MKTMMINLLSSVSEKINWEFLKCLGILFMMFLLFLFLIGGAAWLDVNLYKLLN